MFLMMGYVSYRDRRLNAGLFKWRSSMAIGVGRELGQVASAIGAAGFKRSRRQRFLIAMLGRCKVGRFRMGPKL